MFSDSIQVPSISTIISTLASIAASTLFIHSIINKYLSPKLQDYIYFKLRAFISSFFSQMTLVIEEFDGLEQNQLFKAADIYLRKINHSDAHVLEVVLATKQSKISFSMEKSEETIDTFGGVAYKWKLDSKEIKSTGILSLHEDSSDSITELRCFKLRFHKKHRESASRKYLQHVLTTWKAVEVEKKTPKLFTLNIDVMGGGNSNPWVSVEFDHPATFDTLAMDTELKRTVVEDLERFVKGKEYYRKIGKPWKRVYLLFGPPGTGKSSLVAAMANYLNFDIYDLELSNIWNNSQLRTLLISTANRSIILVEDIDCSPEFQHRRLAAGVQASRGEQGYQVTLSGLLNFVDGLWSSCGDEQIIVFTTNDKDRLNEALLRPGRMDLHIHMSYCTPRGFRTLAFSYNGITEHPLFSKVEQLIESTKVTPAEVGEQLLKDGQPEIALRGLIAFLQKKKESDEIKASEIALGPLEEEATPELIGEMVQSKKSQETHEIQQIVDW